MISFDFGSHKFQVRAAAIFIWRSSVLLHRLEDDSFWALPGGRVEPGENAAETVVREMREELEQDAVCGPLTYVANLRRRNFFMKIAVREITRSASTFRRASPAAQSSLMPRSRTSALKAIKGWNSSGSRLRAFATLICARLSCASHSLCPHHISNTSCSTGEKAHLPFLQAGVSSARR